MAATGPSQGSAMSEINVTPLVDVMLVLLIIFMIASPLIQKGVEVSVPRTGPVATVAELGAKLVIRVRREGASDAIYLGERKVPLEALPVEVKNHPKVQKDKIVFLDAQPDVSYGSVVRVMAAAKSSNVELGLVTRE